MRTLRWLILNAGTRGPGRLRLNVDRFGCTFALVMTNFGAIIRLGLCHTSINEILNSILVGSTEVPHIPSVLCSQLIYFSRNCPAMIYNFYIYSRNGACLYYEDWNRRTAPKSMLEEQKLMFGLM